MLTALLLGLALDAAAAAPSYKILAACDASAEVRAQVASDAAVDIRFAIAGSQTCYAVSATVDGKPVRGFVIGRGLEAIERFEKERAKVEHEAFQAAPVSPAPVLPKAASNTPNATPESPAKQPKPEKPEKKAPKIEL